MRAFRCGILLLLLSSGSAYAFPHAIGFGYKSCLTCHFNPLGNGPLTDYGRALGATEFSARPFFVESRTSDEQLAETSGLLGSASNLPRWLRGQVGFRELYLVSGLESKPLSQFILMQADASLILKFARDSIYFVGNLGYVPVPTNASAADRATISTVISREHYLGVRTSKSLGIYAGFMDIAFGIRVPDHNAYIRSRTLLDKNDQTHGLLVHYTGPHWDGAIHGIAGNLFQDPTSAQRGGSAIAEFDVGENLRLGGSALYTSSTYRSRMMGAGQVRWGIPEGSAVLGELGVAQNSPNGGTAQLNGFGFFQTQTRLNRGLNFLTTWEYYTDQVAGTLPQLFRFGPSLDYFPMQRLELRVDFLSTRQWGGDSVNPDTLTLLSQVHIWL